MNVFFLPVGNNDLHANPPSANLSGCAIAENGFCGDPAVGGLWGGAARGMVMMKRCIKVLWDLVLRRQETISRR